MTMPSVKQVGTIGALLGKVTKDCTHTGVMGVKITGTFSATLTFEGSIDGINWDLIPASTVEVTPAVVTGATAPGVWQVNTSGFRLFRVNCPVTYVSGTAVITLSPSFSGMGATSNPVTLTYSGALAAGSAAIGSVKDGGPAWTSVHGVTAAPFTSADQHSGVASVTDAPTSGQKLVITDLIVAVDTTMSVTFKCETSGAIIAGPFYMAANSSQQFTPRSKAWKLATADKKLQVLTSVAGNIMVDAHYFSE